MGGYGFLFRLEFFFQTTRELEYIFFCRAMREFFFLPEINIKLYDKNSESDYYFFPPSKSEYFSTLGIRIFFLEKNHNPPPSS